MQTSGQKKTALLPYIVFALSVHIIKDYENEKHYTLRTRMHEGMQCMKHVRSGCGCAVSVIQRLDNKIL
jgi:hypothetical protein